MRLKMIALALTAALALLLAVIVSARTLAVEEAPLTSYGKVYEVNGDAQGPFAQGSLFISDNDAREIWQVNASGAYTVYTLASPPLDARPDQDGDIWWTDGASTFGRIDVSQNTVTTWDADQAYDLRGLTLDDQGRLWLTQTFGPSLYRFEPGLSAGLLCTYTLPGGSYAEYVVHDPDQGHLWLAAWGEQRIFRLDPQAGSNQVTFWQIADASSFPSGAALDGQGHLWWADSGLGALARLEPDLNRMTFYSLPVGSQPRMIALQGDRIWYTEFTSKSPGTVGLLDPNLASGASSTLQAFHASVTPACVERQASNTQAVTVRSGQLSWTAGTTDPVFNQDGWTIYQQDATYKPYGIALQDGYLWTAVQGAQKLLRYALALETSLHLTAVASPSAVYHGQAIHYTYTVTYTSSDNSPANTVIVQDNRCSPVTFIGGDDGDGFLGVDETWLYGCQRLAPAHVDGESTTITNTATLTAMDANGQAVSPAEAGASVSILHREGALGLAKSGPASAPHGQTITYTYAVSYASADYAPATGIIVTDDKCGPVTGPDPAGDSNGNALLDVDETWLYTCSFLVPEHDPAEENPLINVGAVSGQDLDGDPVTAGQDQHQLQIVHDYTVHLPTIVGH